MGKDIRVSSALVIVLALALSGCAGTVKNMREVPDAQAITKPAPGKAMVVFMRPSAFGFAVQSSVFDAGTATPELIGIVAAKTKVAYSVNPGKHTFMAVGETGEFMDAELLPNKTYYVEVVPKFGLWKARFGLAPTHIAQLGTPEFNSSLKDCKWVELSPESQQWARENRASIQSKYTENFSDWLKLPAEEKPQLLSEDGR